MLGVQRIPSYVALPACVIGGAALRCLLIQVNQLVVKWLGLNSFDYHDGHSSHERFQTQAYDNLASLEESYGIPESDSQG